MGAFLRKYATATTIDGMPLVSLSTGSLKANPTLVAGDVMVSKDGGAFANIEGAGSFGDFVKVTPTGGTSVQLLLTASLLTCARLTVRFQDAAGAEWDDLVVVVETFGNASAQITGDLNNLDATITSRHASGAAVAKSPATLDWSADVSNKPTIGTSTLSTSDLTSANAVLQSDLAAAHGSGPWGSAVAPNYAIATITCTDGSGHPLAGVRVWTTSDQAGSTMVSNGEAASNASGIATLQCPKGAQYLWRQKTGYTFTNPQRITVT